MFAQWEARKLAINCLIARTFKLAFIYCENEFFQLFLTTFFLISHEDRTCREAKFIFKAIRTVVTFNSSQLSTPYRLRDRQRVDWHSELRMPLTCFLRTHFAFSVERKTLPNVSVIDEVMPVMPDKVCRLINVQYAFSTELLNYSSIPLIYPATPTFSWALCAMWSIWLSVNDNELSDFHGAINYVIHAADSHSLVVCSDAGTVSI